VAETQLLGTMPDAMLAKRLGRSREAVRVRRLLKHVRIFNPTRHEWRPEDDKLLGERPDQYIALLLRVSVSAVRKRRRKLGIRFQTAADG